MSIVKGLFSDTVPKFFDTTNFADVELLLLHIDCDLYQSTKEVLGEALAKTLNEREQIFHVRRGAAFRRVR